MGYDSHEDITFEVAKHSIESRSSVPVDIFPLKRKDLQVRALGGASRSEEGSLLTVFSLHYFSTQHRGIYRRDQDPKQTTEFTYCRFFVPYLSNYKGEWECKVCSPLERYSDSPLTRR